MQAEICRRAKMPVSDGDKRLPGRELSEGLTFYPSMTAAHVGVRCEDYKHVRPVVSVSHGAPPFSDENSLETVRSTDGWGPSRGPAPHAPSTLNEECLTHEATRFRRWA
jgi:hypothetical protein